MIRDGEAHVWLARPVPAGVAPWSVLNDGERARALRFRNVRDTESFVLAHALVRGALSFCVPAIAPSRWTFHIGSHGRPEIAGPAAGLGLRFNLSHADGLVGCVVTVGGDCGLDVETAKTRPGIGVLLSSCLTAGERRRLTLAEPGRRAELFVCFWTLKEAYAKACGLGLALAFDGIEFALEPTPRLVGGDPGWRFELWRPTLGHVAALALRRTDGLPWEIVVHNDLPVCAGAG